MQCEQHIGWHCGCPRTEPLCCDAAATQLRGGTGAGSDAHRYFTAHLDLPQRSGGACLQSDLRISKAAAGMTASLPSLWIKVYTTAKAAAPTLHLISARNSLALASQAFMRQTQLVSIVDLQICSCVEWGSCVQPGSVEWGPQRSAVHQLNSVCTCINMWLIVHLAETTSLQAALCQS